jgi:signal transduction histidine kinase
MRHSLSAIYANAEFLERPDLCADARADLLLEIQEVVLAMTERLDSLLQFSSNGRKNPLARERVSLVVEKAVAAVKLHPDGRNVSITIGTFGLVDAYIDTRSIESAIYNLLLNACQAATRSAHVPEINVHLTETDEQIYITISDNGPGIPASVQTTLFDPFVTAGKPDGTGLGLTLARRRAEEHGGSVWLVESNPGKTVFTLSLTKNTSCSSGELKTGRAALMPAAMDLRTAHEGLINGSAEK